MAPLIASLFLDRNRSRLGAFSTFVETLTDIISINILEAFFSDKPFVGMSAIRVEDVLS